MPKLRPPRFSRRISVEPEERLRTAAERVVPLDLESLSPDLDGLSPLAIQQRHALTFEGRTDYLQALLKAYLKYRIIFIRKEWIK